MECNKCLKKLYNDQFMFSDSNKVQRYSSTCISCRKLSKKRSVIVPLQEQNIYTSFDKLEDNKFYCCKFFSFMF